jgi:hypothetical protein
MEQPALTLRFLKFFKLSGDHTAETVGWANTEMRIFHAHDSGKQNSLK